MKSLILIALVLLGCIAFNEALQCYSHEPCSTNCPQLSSSLKTCTGDENRCYKAAFPGGVSRGCAKERCNVQFNANSVMANICCEKDLCNSAMTPKLTMGAVFMVLLALFVTRM